MKKLVMALALGITTAQVDATTVVIDDVPYILHEGEQVFIGRPIGDAAPNTPTAPNGWTELQFYEYCRNEPKLSDPVEFEEFRAKQEWDKVCHPKTKLPFCSVAGNVAELCSPDLK